MVLIRGLPPDSVLVTELHAAQEQAAIERREQVLEDKERRYRPSKG